MLVPSIPKWRGAPTEAADFGETHRVLYSGGLFAAACVQARASSIRACVSFSFLDWTAQRRASSAYCRNWIRSAFDIDTLPITGCLVSTSSQLRSLWPIESGSLYNIAHSDGATRNLAVDEFPDQTLLLCGEMTFGVRTRGRSSTI